MTSVVERLIESWLDSQTERRYQPAFIQLLVSEGWSVLHNSRHSPIEFGKDVIARNPTGTLHCFQLKGNPGARLTKAAAQILLPQVVELIELPPARTFRINKCEKHVAVFVINSEIDEEARLLLEAAGERTDTGACPAMKLELWSGGILTDLFIRAARKIWPTSVEGTRRVLELMALDGREIPNHQLISSVFEATAPAPNSNTASAAKTANLAALLLLAEIVKAPWYAAENHYGLYAVTVLASVQALRFADSAKRLAAVTQYANLCIEHCADLIKEAQDRKFDPNLIWVQRDIFAESEIMWERRRLVGDCAATLVLSGTAPEDYDVDYVGALVTATFVHPKLFGLAAIPALIVRYWAACRFNAGAHLDLLLARHLHLMLAACLGQVENVKPLAAPYYNFTDCWAVMRGLRYFADDSIFSDSSRKRIWFARAILFMLAKRNYKQTCKRLWPSFSRVIHEEPQLPKAAFFDGTRRRQGRMLTYTFLRKKWDDLIDEAIDDNEGRFLEPFTQLAWLIAAYIAIVPYRSWTGVLMWLDEQLNTTWYNSEHRPSRQPKTNRNGPSKLSSCSRR